MTAFRPLLIVPLLAAILLLAGCTGDGGGGDAGGGSGPTETLDVARAASAPDGTDVRVRGALVARPDDVRLCEMLSESYPPQCGGTDLPLRFRGAVLSGLDVETAQGVGWAEDVVLEGTLRDGNLFVTGRG